MMLAGLGIAVAACAAMIGLVFWKPSVRIRNHAVSIYWLAPMAGAALLWIFGMNSGKAIWEGLTSDSEINPLKILVLFLSMTLISIFLDHAGLFRYLAAAVLRRAGDSQPKLFFLLYATVSVLTVFTSNDIVVLTFTPFICYFAANAKVDPLPYLICEFTAANTWSMALIIGNPTNIYLATAAGIDFMEYLRVMALPTVFSGIASFGALWVLFRKQLCQPLHPREARVKILDPVPVILGVIHLGLCVVFLSIASYISIPMWIIAFGFLVSLYVLAWVFMRVRKTKSDILGQSFRRAPWEIVPFVLSMFVMVLALEQVGLTGRLATLLDQGSRLVNFGVSSFLTANMMNNIPMSVLFSAVVAPVSEAGKEAALYASVIGSNLGAYFTPIGALAGIMWMGMLKNHGIRLTFGGFVRYGTAIAIPALTAALLGLWIVL